MSRNLNTRQMQFAAKVAEGKPLVAAYREVYQPANGKAPSTYRNARRSAKHPGIAARIEELQIQLLPAPEDMKAVYAHGLARMIQLSNCEDKRVSYLAAQWLCAEAKEQAEKREALEAARTPNQQEDIVAELRALYRKALPEREPLVEVVSDEMAVGQAGEAPAENLLQVAGPLAKVAAGAESACGEDEAPEPGETAAMEVPLVAQTPNPPVQYRLERVPGRFPPAFRRVPIQT